NPPFSWFFFFFFQKCFETAKIFPLFPFFVWFVSFGWYCENGKRSKGNYKTSGLQVVVIGLYDNVRLKE
ncbi:hypothetical protein ACISSW_28600, partial [Escherichia coli]